MFPNIVFTPEKKRSAFLAIAAYLEQKNAVNMVRNVQPSSLRLISPILPNKSSLAFQTQRGTSSSDIPDEIKLDKADAFFCTSIAFGINKVDLSQTPLAYSNNPIAYYPDATAFPGTKTGNQPEANALLPLYYGKLTIQSGSQFLLQDFYMNELLDVPASQDEQHKSASMEDASFNLGCFLPLCGQQNYDLKIEFASGDRTISDGSYSAAGSTQAITRNYGNLILRGFVVKNGAQLVLAQNLFQF